MAHLLRKQGNFGRMGCWLLLAGVAGASGCLVHLQPVAPPDPCLLQPCQSVPRCCRGHVHIFLVNGLDPLDCCNLTDVCESLHELGFLKTYYGQMYHAHSFTKVIRRLHDEDADARFVLIGYGLGANVARCMAQKVVADGVHIDLLVYLGCSTLADAPENRPENVGRVVNIAGNGCLEKGHAINGADNILLARVSHRATPTHPETLKRLAEELAQIASEVPFEMSGEPRILPDDESAPTPRSLRPGPPAELLPPPTKKP